MNRITSQCIRWLNFIALLLTVAINALAVLLPINGVQTGEVSNAYPNLFTPAAMTFSVWGVIYTLLLAFTIYQLRVSNKGINKKSDAVDRIGWLFVMSCAFNIAWIFCWHYQLMPLSLICIVGMLVTLGMSYRRIRAGSRSVAEKIFVQLPFSVYFGWITVAVIANTAVMLVSLGWDAFGISESLWTFVILVIGLLIGLNVIIRNHDLPYALVLAWAFLGIYIKHQSADGYARAYPLPMWTAFVAMMIIMAAGVISGIRAKRA